MNNFTFTLPLLSYIDLEKVDREFFDPEDILEERFFYYQGEVYDVYDSTILNETWLPHTNGFSEPRRIIFHFITDGYIVVEECDS